MKVNIVAFEAACTPVVAAKAVEAMGVSAKNTLATRSMPLSRTMGVKRCMVFSFFLGTEELTTFKVFCMSENVDHEQHAVVCHGNRLLFVSSFKHIGNERASG